MWIATPFIRFFLILAWGRGRNVLEMKRGGADEGKVDR
jgi:hypothetical protein